MGILRFFSSVTPHWSPNAPVLPEIWSIIYFSFEKCSASCWKFSLINIVCFVKLVDTYRFVPLFFGAIECRCQRLDATGSPSKSNSNGCTPCEIYIYLYIQRINVLQWWRQWQTNNFQANKIHSSFLSMLFIMSSVSLTPLSDAGTVVHAVQSILYYTVHVTCNPSNVHFRPFVRRRRPHDYVVFAGNDVTVSQSIRRKCTFCFLFS